MGKFNNKFNEKLNFNVKNERANTTKLDSSEINNESNDNVQISQEVEKSNTSVYEELNNASPSNKVIIDIEDRTKDFDTETKRLVSLPIKSIETAEYNPYREYDVDEEGERALEELTNNIATFGLIHPLLVNKIGNRYILISGERRLKAAQKLGWDNIDCYITTVEDKTFSEGLLFSANTQTRNLKPIDIFKYIDNLNKIYTELAASGRVSDKKKTFIQKNINLSRTQLFRYNYIKENINVLSEEEKTAFYEGDISVSKIYSLVNERIKCGIDKTTINQNSSIVENSGEDTVEKQGIEEVSSPNDSSEYLEEIDKKTDENESSCKSESISVDSNITDITEENCEDISSSINNDATVDVKGESQPENFIHELIQLNSGFLSVILDGEEKAPIYEAVSNAGRKVYGYLLSTDISSFIIFPRTVEVKDTNESSGELSASFSLFKVDRQTIKLREDGYKK